MRFTLITSIIISCQCFLYLSPKLRGSLYLNENGAKPDGEGNKSWNKGKKLPDAVASKIQSSVRKHVIEMAKLKSQAYGAPVESYLGKTKKEYLMSVGKPLVQKKYEYSQEYRDKQSKTMKEKWKDPIYRANIIKKLRKRVISPETRAKISKTVKEQWASGKKAARTTPAYRSESRLRKISESVRKAWSDPEYHERMCKMFRKRKKNEKWKALISNIMTEKWSDPAYRTSQLKYMSQRRKAGTGSKRSRRRSSRMIARRIEEEEIGDDYETPGSMIDISGEDEEEEDDEEYDDDDEEEEEDEEILGKYEEPIPHNRTVEEQWLDLFGTELPPLPPPLPF